MVKKILALVAASAMISSMLPHTLMSVSASYTGGSKEIVVYENDFSEDNWFDGNTGDELKVIGGWDKSGNSAFQGWAGNTSTTDYGFVPGSAPGIAELKKNDTNGSSEWYLPDWAKASTGVYTYSFWFYRGRKTNHNYIAFNDANAWNSSTTVNLFELSYSIGTNIGQGASRLVEIKFDMDNDTATLKTYSSNANYENGIYEANVTQEWTRDYVNYICFRVRGSNSFTVEDNQQGYVSMIDDFKVTYAPPAARYVEGNVYSEDFDAGIQPNANYNTEGGWQFGCEFSTNKTDYPTDSDRTGYSVGRYGANPGFVPAFALFQQIPTSNLQSASAYFIEPSKMNTSGKYRVNFDFYRGEKTNHNYIRFVPTHSLDNNKSVNIELSYSAGCSKQTWYNVDMVIDLDSDTYVATVYNADGTQKWTTSGEYTGASLGAVMFRVRASNSFAASAYKYTEYQTVIDNLEINYEEPFELNMTEEVNYGGEKLELNADDVLDVSEELYFRNGYVNTGDSGYIQTGDRKITGENIYFTNSGVIFMEDGDAAKIEKDNEYDSTATDQGFVVGIENPTGNVEIVLEVEGTVGGTNYTDRTITESIDFSGSELNGLVNFGFAVTNIPKPLVLKLKSVN